jgi:hypothetical protein
MVTESRGIVPQWKEKAWWVLTLTEFPLVSLLVLGEAAGLFATGAPLRSVLVPLFFVTLAIVLVGAGLTFDITRQRGLYNPAVNRLFALIVAIVLSVLLASFVASWLVEAFAPTQPGLSRTVSGIVLLVGLAFLGITVWIKGRGFVHD